MEFFGGNFYLGNNRFLNIDQKFKTCVLINIYDYYTVKYGTPINNYVILLYAPFSPTALFVIIIIITDLILFMINCNERI